MAKKKIVGSIIGARKTGFHANLTASVGRAGGHEDCLLPHESQFSRNRWRHRSCRNPHMDSTRPQNCANSGSTTSVYRYLVKRIKVQALVKRSIQFTPPLSTNASRRRAWSRSCIHVGIRAANAMALSRCIQASSARPAANAEMPRNSTTSICS